jgi:2,3-dihydroxybenzoate-AMP ligase
MIAFEGVSPDLAARYRQEGYWRGETLDGLLRRWARTEGGRTAIVQGAERWSYGDLDAKAAGLAAGLRALGVRREDRVVVQLPNVASFVTVSIALYTIGALPVYALPSQRRSEITHLCGHAEAVAYVVSDVYHGFDYRVLAGDVQAAVASLRHVLVAGDPGPYVALDAIEDEPLGDELERPSPQDVAFFLLSGGTTGLPKLIPRTHDDYAYQLRATSEEMGVGEHTVYLAGLPIGHNAALGCPGVLGTLRSGGKVVLAASPSPDETMPLVEREGVTLTTLMPPHVLLWLETADVFDVDLSGVVLIVGSSHLPPHVARRVRPELGCTLTQWFGMAEGLLTLTRPDDPEEYAVHTQGRPLSPADEVRVVDDEGRDVPAGEVGELLTRGPYTLRGYYRVPEHNANAFTADGFLRTGDLVRIDGNGNMVVEGRIKDVVNRGGEKISAAEVEDHLVAHPAVRDAAVVAMPDEVLGEKTCAFVVARDGAPTLAELASFLRARGLADYKVPERLELVDAFPRTNVGKVNKARLREQIAGKLE